MIPLKNKDSKALYSKIDNYKFVISILEKIAKNSSNKTILGAIAHISIDNLSTIINNQGDDFAEITMEGIVSQIEKRINTNDTVIRTQKDQIHVILKDYDETEYQEIIKTISNIIQNYGCVTSLEPIQLKASIGSTKLPNVYHEKIAIETLNKAYIALSDAKDLFLKYIAFEDSKKRHEESKSQMVMAHYIQNAFLNGKMCLAFQAIINTKTKKPEYYECLLRIVNEDGTASSVGPFIPIAEKMGFIEIMDGIALKMAIEELKKNPELILSVNVSSITIHNSNWLSLAIGLLSDSTVASRLIVEITETSIKYDIAKISYFMTAVKALGCKVALDDFGVGYTSFKQIKNLPIDILKIDGSYVRGVSENEDDLFFVQTLLAFANNFGLQSVAEFVENKEISDIVTGIGVTYIQGNFFHAASTIKPWTS